MWCAALPVWRGPPGVRVLSLDGGGVRGLAALLVLERLEQLAAARTGDLFDLVVGVSAGAMLAAKLGSGRQTAAQCMERLLQLNGEVFRRGLVSGVGGLLKNGGYYDNSLLERLLVAEYGERRLEEGGKPHIAILSTRTFGHTTAQAVRQRIGTNGKSYY